MMERIKNALAEGPRAAASTIHYLYLARIPFLGWLTLFLLPLFAGWLGRPLVLGAYDLASVGEAFFVGIAYGLAGGSIYFTAHVITNLCSKRFRLVIDAIVQSRIDKVWAGAIIVAFFVNILVAAAASKPIHSYSRQIAGAMVLGMLVAFAGALIAREISFRLAKNPTYRGLVWLGIKIGLRKQKGYLRPVSADAETDDPAKWEYEDGQIRAVCYTFIVIVAYCVITGKQVAPLVALMLLVSLWVLVLAGVTFLGPLPVTGASYSGRLFLARRVFSKGRPLLSGLDQTQVRSRTDAGRNRRSSSEGTSTRRGGSSGWRRYSIGRLDYFGLRSIRQTSEGRFWRRI